MIHITDLQVSIDEKPIINQFSLTMLAGTTHAIMGPNGSGKSTLAYTLIGHPLYKITGGNIRFLDHDLIDLSPDKRAQRGIFLAFQQPPSIPGVEVLTFLHEAYSACTGNTLEIKALVALVERYITQLHIHSGLIYRKLNDGFSGGEKKQLEMLQLLLLRPKLAILDEIDSGLDIDALRHVAAGIAHAREENPDLTVLIITHYQRILRYIIPDRVHIMCAGALVASGGAQLADELEHKGYDGYR